MIQDRSKLAKDCIKAGIPKTYKFQKKNNEISCLQWLILIQDDALACHIGPKLTDFAPKLAKVAAKSAKVGRSRAKLAQSWAEVGTKMPPRRPKIGQKHRDPQRESAEEPPRSHQGPHFRIQCPQGCPQIKSRMKEQSTGTARAKEHGTGQGTRDTG